VLSGCAEVMLVANTTALVKALPPREARWVETHRVSFSHPAAQLYALVAQEAEHHDRKIVERDAPSGTLVLSYPFSWLKNNWGGTLKITCSADAHGTTTVTILGDGRDAPARVRAIGDEILADLEQALRRQPRML
jgi:hypothetical protein